MMRGLRVSDAPTLTRLCSGDMKLFLRLGVLLQAKLSFSEPALEGAIAHAHGKALLTDRRLRDCLPAAFPALVAEHHVEDLGLVMVDHERGAEPGWRLVAIEDELDNPLLPDASREAVPVAGDLATLMPTLQPAIRTPLEGLLQARADDQRAAALEQLRYAMPPLAVVSELMPMILSDAADLVRERSIGLLGAAGAHTAVIDLIRALIRRDDATFARLHEPIGRLPAVQQDLVVAAVIAALARGEPTQALVDCCRSLAAHLAHHRSLPHLIELLLPSRLSLLDLVRTLQEHARERVDALLLGHLGLTPERDAQIVILLADPRSGSAHPEAERLLRVGVGLLISPQDSPPERMALAAALIRLHPTGHLLTDLLAEAGMALGRSYDTAVYWLIAECCRNHTLVPATGESLAQTLRRLLREASGPHLIAILEQQLPALLPASDATRASLVEPMIETVPRFIDERSRDLVISCLAGIGAPALAPLWTLLEEHPHLAVRLVGAELVPELLRDADAATTDAAVRRLLSGLTRAEQAAERGALLTAAARLAGTPAGSPPLVAAVDEALTNLGRWAIEALGYLGASPHLAEERRTAIVDALLADITAALPDGGDRTVTDSATQEVTFILDERLGYHTETVPTVLRALERIGASPATPRDLTRTISTRLCLQWRRVATWQVVWGPGNVQELAQTLGRLAEGPAFPGPLRLQICEALLPSIGQLPIARSLARVFTASEGSYLSQLAGKAAATLIGLASERYYAEDEQEALAEVLVDVLAIPHLGPDVSHLRRRLVSVIQVLRQSLTSRARVKLRYLLEELEPDLRAKLDWAH